MRGASSFNIYTPQCLTLLPSDWLRVCALACGIFVFICVLLPRELSGNLSRSVRHRAARCVTFWLFQPQLFPIYNFDAIFRARAFNICFRGYSCKFQKIIQVRIINIFLKNYQVSAKTGLLILFMENVHVWGSLWSKQPQKNATHVISILRIYREKIVAEIGWW